MYDLKEIKSIKCMEIAQNYGIELEKKGDCFWGKLRNEKTSSFSISLTKNLWYDFGAGEGGSVIDLLAKLENITASEAINKLAKDFCIDNKKEKNETLTDNQFIELGIQPELATMNFAMDVNVHGVRKLERWSKKYNMTVQELAEKYPDTYDRMVYKISTREINQEIKNYNELFENYYNANNVDAKEIYKTFAKETSLRINKKVDLLEKALHKNFFVNQNNFPIKVDFVGDYENIKTKIKLELKEAYKSSLNVDSLTNKQIDIFHSMKNSTGKYISVNEIERGYKIHGKNIEQNIKDDYEIFHNYSEMFDAIRSTKQHNYEEKEMKNTLIKDINLEIC